LNLQRVAGLKKFKVPFKWTGFFALQKKGVRKKKSHFVWQITYMYTVIIIILINFDSRSVCLRFQFLLEHSVITGRDSSSSESVPRIRPRVHGNMYSARRLATGKPRYVSGLSFLCPTLLIYTLVEVEVEGVGVGIDIALGAEEIA
jgi:hypothetical protein